MIEAPERVGFRLDGGAAALARLLGANAKPTKIEKLPNGRALYFDLPIKHRPLARRMIGAQARMWRRFMGYTSELHGDPQLGGVGDTGIPTRSQIIVFQVSLTPASVATIVCTEQALTVTGILTTDVVVVATPRVNNATNALPALAHASAADTIRIGYCNPTAGAVVPTPGMYDVVVLRG